MGLVDKYLANSVKNVLVHPNEKLLKERDPHAFTKASRAESLENLRDALHVYEEHASLEEYHEKQNPLNYVHNLHVPLLCINSADDPVRSLQ